MRKFFKVIGILNIFAVIFFMVGFSVISASTTDPEMLRILGRMEYFVYISGAIILLGTSGNVTFALNENLWKKAEALDEERWKWYEGNTKLKKQKQVLADAITNEYKKDKEYARGYDDGYKRHSLEQADKEGLLNY